MKGFKELDATTPDGVSLRMYDRAATAAGSASAPVLVLANGLGGNVATWRHAIRYFGPTHRIVTWDYRGLYGSTLLPEQARGGVELGVESHVADTFFVLDHLGVDRAVLMGWSMGVQLGFDVVSRAPDRFDAMIALSGGYGRVFDHTVMGRAGTRVIMPGMDLVRRALTRFSGPIARIAKAPVLIKTLKTVGAVGRNLDEQVFMELVSEYVQLDFDVYNRILESLHHHDVESTLSKLTLPVLVMAGDRDPMTPHAVSLKMLDRLPDAELVILPGGTHYMPVEFPEEINQRISRFLGERLGHSLGHAAP